MSSAPNQTTGASAPDAPTQGAPKEKVLYNFPLSEIPKNPLGEGKYIKTAGCLIIGCVVACSVFLAHSLTLYPQGRDLEREDAGQEL